MKLSEIRCLLTEGQTEAIRSSNVWGGLRPAWPDALYDGAAVRAAWSALSACSARTLKTVLSRFGALPFTEEQLLAASDPGAPGIEVRLGLLRLQEYGIVFCVRRGWGEKLYLIPGDTYTAWWGAAFAGNDREGLLEDNAVQPREGQGCSLGIRLIHMLAELVRSGPHLTVKGVPAKRTLDKCAAQLGLEAGDVSVLLPAGAEVPYPPALAFALDLAGACGWLQKGERKLVIAEDQFGRWLSLCPDERESELFLCVTQRYGLRSALTANTAAALSAIPPLQWFAPDSVTQHLRSVACPQDDSPIKRLVRDWCRAMAAFGWMETGTTPDGEDAARWLIRPVQPYASCCRTEESMPVRATPDGELFVPPDVPGAVIWKLERIAERRTADVFAVYRLTDRSVRAAADTGITARAIIRTLEEACREPLPETVRLAIESWTAASAEATVGPDPGGAGGPGFDLFGGPCPLDGCRLIHEAPSVRSLLPGIEAIPSVWTNRLRAYHPSTRRELLEKALNWRSSVKLSREGAVLPFVPERLEDGEGGWAVVGRLGEQREPVTLFPDMWQEMMIVVPAEEDGRGS